VQHILTDLSKHSTDDALDEDQCPGESELLLLVSLAIITPSAGRFKKKITLSLVQQITHNRNWRLKSGDESVDLS